MTNLEQRILDYLREPHSFPGWTTSGILAVYFEDSVVTDEVFRRRTRQVGKALKDLYRRGYLKRDRMIPRPGYRLRGS